MAILQKLILGLMPQKWAAAIEAESRLWMMRCPDGHEISVWDAGGIRYKAKGKPRTLSVCIPCGKWRWMTFHERDAPSTPSDPAGAAS